ncbi:phage tail protein [Bacillus cereus group sp. IBL03679]|uniref:phage tail protein n=1 Tax=Bacillus cereus group sp. IBL03679 TaxID=3240095 RepID=UPI003D2F5CA8
MASIIDIIVKANDNASRVLDNVADKANSTGTKIAAIGAVASASMPALLAGLGGAVALMGTAGVAVAGFGALAMTSITGVIETTGELEKAQEKIDNASNAKERSKALQEQQVILNGLTAEERKAVTATMDFKANWKDMQDEMSPTTFTMMANGMDLTNNVMTKMFPAMKGVGNSFAGMLGQMNQAIEGGKADAFFEHMNTFAVLMFEMAMKSVGNILKGLSNIMIAFTPLGMDMRNGLVDLTAKFASWSAGLQSSTAFQSFVSFVQTSTPIIMNIIGQLWGILVKLVTALAPLGLAVLTLASNFLTWANNSGFVQAALDLVSAAGTWLSQNMQTVQQVLVAVVAGFVAFKAALAIGSVITTVVTAINGFRQAMVLAQATTTAMRLATTLLNATLLANPLMWIAGLIALVVAAGVLLYMNWDTVKAKAIELWNKMKEMWEGIKQAWNEGVEATKQYFANLWSDATAKANEIKTNVSNKFNELWNTAKTIWNTGIAQMKALFLNLAMEVVQKALQLKSDVTNTFNELWNSAKQVWNTGVQQIKQFFTNLYNDAKTIAGNIKQGIVDKFNELWNQAKNLWNTGINALKSIISNSVSAFTSAVCSIVTGIVDGFRNGFTTAVNTVQTGVKNCWSAIKNFTGDFLSAGKGLLSAFVDGMKSGIGNAVSAVSDGMAKVRSYLPFSPAKKGPLSDLDKSGKSFFPTWYESALTQVKPMTRAIGGAMNAVSDQMENGFAGESLRAFTGGKPTVTVNHVVTVDGAVDLDGRGLQSIEQKLNQQVNDKVAGYDNTPEYLKDLRQAMRKR